MTSYRLLDADIGIFEEVADDGKSYRSFKKGETSEYKALLEDVIANAGAALDVDVPDWLQADADQTLFDRQLAAYRTATARLAQYIVADGRAEVREMQPTGEQVFNEETMEMEDVMMEVIVQTAIEPVDPTVENTEYDSEGNATTTTIENPIITQDNTERATAQSVVDSTPEAVIEAAS